MTTDQSRFAAQSRVTPATAVAFTEGPAVDADGSVYFSDIENNRILKLAPNGERSVFREPSHRTPAGELKDRIAIDEDVLTNLAFGGSDGRTLYITAGKTLFTTRIAVPGQVAWPRFERISQG